MANKELDKMRSIISNLDSEATSKPQPSKTMNGGSAKIDGASPTSPSTNPATRREQYNNYIKTLDKDQASKLYQTVSNYKEMGLTNEQIYENVLSSAERNKNGIVEPAKIATTPNYTIDLKTKGNFDMYEPKIDETNADATFQKAISQLNDSVKGLGSLKLASENYQYTTGSTNVADINNLIKEIQKAYTAGVYDTSTIANQLGVDQEVIRKIQQGKASELVSIGEEFAQEQLKDFFRAEEDYDTNLQRTMEDYNLAKTNLDAQFNSAMQTLKRSMFDEKRAASVGSAIADRSGSEYMIQRVEKGYQQNMDDLENNYLYSSLKQRASYIRAIQDYNTNIQRLGEDFDDTVKSIQLSVLQQFQEIDNKILTAEDNLKALSKLQGSTSTAMSEAVLKYIQGIEDENERQKAMQNFIAANYGYDVSELLGTKISSEDVANAYNGFVTKFADVIKNGGKIRQGRCGEPVNEYLKFLGMDLQITQANDLKPYAKSQTPTPGSIAYFDGTQSRATPDGKKYGHTGIVVDYDLEKGKVTLLESNKNTGMRTREYNLSDVTGYLDPTKQGTSGQSIAGGEETGAGTSGRYQESDHGMYESFLTGKGWSDSKAKTVKSDPTYGKTEDERRTNFKAATKAYQSEKAKGSIQGIQERLDTVVEFKNRYNELNESEREELRYAEILDEHGLIKTAGLSERALNVANLYNQIKGQLFINGIIDSKSQGAAYGNLSDAEGNRISQAASAMNLNSPSYLGTHVNYLINNLSSNISELGGAADITSGYNFSIEKNKGTKFTNIVPASRLINPGSSTEFNTQGGINLSSTGTTNTGTFEIPFTNMK